MESDLMRASRSFLLSDGSVFGKNVLNGADMSSSVKIDNKKRRYLDS